MSTFEAAYREGEPVKVLVQQDFELIVVGFVEFEDGVGWMDDGFMDPMPGHPPLHFTTGEVRRDGDHLLVAGNMFSAMEHGDRVAGVWYELFEGADVRAVQRAAEEVIKARYAQR